MKEESAHFQAAYQRHTHFLCQGLMSGVRRPPHTKTEVK